VQPADGDVDAGIGEFAAQPTDRLAGHECAVPAGAGARVTRLPHLPQVRRSSTPATRTWHRARSGWAAAGDRARRPAELLGLDNSAAVRKLVASLGSGGDARGQVIVLGLVLGSLEARTPKDAWRNASSGWLTSGVKSGEHLKFLAAQGYTLRN
jgi:hypothetical protein